MRGRGYNSVDGISYESSWMGYRIFNLFNNCRSYGEVWVTMRKFEQTKLTSLLLEAIRCAILLAQEDGPESDIFFIHDLERLTKKIQEEKLDVRLVSREY